MKATLRTIKPTARIWRGDKGDVAFIEGTLEDEHGTADWSVGCKPENEPARRAELTALIDQPGEYTLESKADYQGRRQVKIASWPGKPQQGGFGGKAAFVPRFRDTEEGFAREQQSIHRSVALQHAVTFCANLDSPYTEAQVIDVAGKFYQWLSQRSGAESNGGQPAETVRAGRGSLAPGGAAAPPSISEETKMQLTQLLFQKLGHVPKQQEALAYLGGLSVGVLGERKLYPTVAEVPESDAQAFIRHLAGELTVSR